MTDPYEVKVNLAAHELTTLRDGRAVMRARVGEGGSATPTPRGYFYMIEKLRMVPATGPYGTYAFGLSAYSNTLTTFGTGDAQIALHGTDEPASIGQNSSNGCVHLLDRVANWIARTLPLGTPVQIS
jgi:lipoprotein-anchoring transpeptidase ErfK/SrfK